MNYSITAHSVAKKDASLVIKNNLTDFGTTEQTADTLPNPAELFLGSFAACILKNVERFSELLHYSFDGASIKVTAERYERPPRMNHIQYHLTVFSNDKRLKTGRLKMNIEKYGTIFNTVKAACAIEGTITVKESS